jgi:hypothetical protein
VLGVERATVSHDVVFVQVVNHARKPMRLQSLQYTFGAGGEATYDEVALRREIEPGAAAVIEVPLDLEDLEGHEGEELTLRGRLYAAVDQIEQSFAVVANVTP